VIIFLPLLVALGGLLMYAFASNPKVQELGRIMFFCGVLAFLLKGGGEAVGLLGK
jgi:Na+/phosphate symporter